MLVTTMLIVLALVETSDTHIETNLCKWSHDHVFSMSTKTQTTIKKEQDKNQEIPTKKLAL